MKHNKHKTNGFGLAEVLVGLAITGGVLITIMSVAISAYRQVKNNEMGDYANNVMIMSVEYFKTPISDVTKEPASILNAITLGKYQVFKINGYLNDDAANFQVIQTSPQPLSLIDGNLPDDVAKDLDSCSSLNPDYFFVRVNSNDQASQIQLCNKIVIAHDINGYRILSIIAYQKTRSELVSSRIIGFRQKL